MGIKLLWAGLTIIMALSSIVKYANYVGSLLMGVGLILLLLDK